MSRKQKMDEVNVFVQLNNKRDVRIKMGSKVIEIIHPESSFKAFDLGNGSWGKIDFLVNYCGYTKVFVEKFVG